MSVNEQMLEDNAVAEGSCLLSVGAKLSKFFFSISFFLYSLGTEIVSPS